VVIEADPAPDHATGVLQGLEPVAVHALILERSYDSLDYTVQLGTVESDELLAQAVAFDQDRVASTGEDQAVVRSQKERRLDRAEMPVSSNQRLLQCRFSGLGSAAAAQMPSQQFPRVVIDHQSQCGPSFIRRSSHRGQGLYPGAKPHRLFAHLPAHDLEHALHSVLVHAQQMRHGAVAEGLILFDHGLDRLDELLLDLGLTLGGLVVKRAPRHCEPAAKLDRADYHAIVFECQLKLQDHFSSSLPSREFNFFLTRSSSIASAYASCSSRSCRSNCYLISRVLVRSAFSMPFLPSSTHSSSSDVG